MEKEIGIGSVGKLDLSFAGGKAIAKVGIIIPGGLSVDVAIQEDASALVDLLFAAIEKNAAPGTVAIEEAVKAIIKQAVLAIQ